MWLWHMGKIMPTVVAKITQQSTPHDRFLQTAEPCGTQAIWSSELHEILSRNHSKVNKLSCRVAVFIEWHLYIGRMRLRSFQNDDTRVSTPRERTGCDVVGLVGSQVPLFSISRHNINLRTFPSQTASIRN